MEYFDQEHLRGLSPPTLITIWVFIFATLKEGKGRFLLQEKETYCIYGTVKSYNSLEQNCPSRREKMAMKYIYIFSI